MAKRTMTAEQARLIDERGHVTRPVVYEKAVHIRLSTSTVERLDAMRGSLLRSDFTRQLLLKALDAEEARRRRIEEKLAKNARSPETDAGGEK